MKRSWLIGLLLVLYAWPFIERRGIGPDGNRLDPLQPQGREVERAIANNRFADALRIALDLQRTHPQEPLAAYWLATIYRGMDRPRDEMDAWERYMTRSTAPEAACPRIARLYEDAGDRPRALQEYERCAQFDPRRPDRLVDLGEAAERFGDVARAARAFERAVELDPTDVAVREHLQQLSRGAEGGS